jgi:hypothetical protein
MFDMSREYYVTWSFSCHFVWITNCLLWSICHYSHVSRDCCHMWILNVVWHDQSVITVMCHVTVVVSCDFYLTWRLNIVWIVWFFIIHVMQALVSSREGCLVWPLNVFWILDYICRASICVCSLPMWLWKSDSEMKLYVCVCVCQYVCMHEILVCVCWYVYARMYVIFIGKKKHTHTHTHTEDRLTDIQTDIHTWSLLCIKLLMVIADSAPAMAMVRQQPITPSFLQAHGRAKDPAPTTECTCVRVCMYMLWFVCVCVLV